MLDASTPVVIGCGQCVDRTAALDDAMSPVDLSALAAGRAIEDTHSRSVARSIDTVIAIRLFADSIPGATHPHGRIANLPRSIAQRVGADPTRAVYAEVGGNTPQKYLNLMAEEIRRNRAGVVLLAGGEAIATAKRCSREAVTLDWQSTVGGSQEDKGFGEALWSEQEFAHGIGIPVQTYPLFEQAIRARQGASVAQHLLAMGRLLHGFSEIAAVNPYAFYPTRRSAEELAAVTQDNPFIGFPYPRFMNARDAVNQGAAVLLTSVGKARSLGIPPQRWVFLHGCADVNEIPFMLHRRDYHSSPALELAAQRALAMAGLNVDEIGCFDLYSCFPSAVEVALTALSIADDDPRDFTVTGGLPFFGGPGNNYSMHAIAEMVGRLRDSPDSYGLITANGGHLSKQSVGIYGARPLPGVWHREPPAHYQPLIDTLEHPASTATPDGVATVETYTVVFSRSGPAASIVIGRLGDGRRFVANTAEQDWDRLLQSDCVGHSGTVASSQGRNTFRLD